MACKCSFHRLSTCVSTKKRCTSCGGEGVGHSRKAPQQHSCGSNSAGYASVLTAGLPHNSSVVTFRIHFQHDPKPNTWNLPREQSGTPLSFHAAQCAHPPTPPRAPPTPCRSPSPPPIINSVML